MATKPKRPNANAMKAKRLDDPAVPMAAACLDDATIHWTFAPKLIVDEADFSEYPGLLDYVCRATMQQDGVETKLAKVQVKIIDFAVNVDYSDLFLGLDGYSGELGRLCAEFSTDELLPRSWGWPQGERHEMNFRVLYISRVEVGPAFRGARLGLAVTADMLRRLGAGPGLHNRFIRCLLQGSPIVTRVESRQALQAAEQSLTRFWSELGFQPWPKGTLNWLTVDPDRLRQKPIERGRQTGVTSATRGFRFQMDADSTRDRDTRENNFRWNN